MEDLKELDLSTETNFILRKVGIIEGKKSSIPPQAIMDCQIADRNEISNIFGEFSPATNIPSCGKPFAFRLHGIERERDNRELCIHKISRIASIVKMYRTYAIKTRTSVYELIVDDN